MEVKETAACGIAQREFAIEFDDDKITNIYQLLEEIHDGFNDHHNELAEDLVSRSSFLNCMRKSKSRSVIKVV